MSTVRRRPRSPHRSPSATHSVSSSALPSLAAPTSPATPTRFVSSAHVGGKHARTHIFSLVLHFLALLFVFLSFFSLSCSPLSPTHKHTHTHKNTCTLRFILSLFSLFFLSSLSSCSSFSTLPLKHSNTHTHTALSDIVPFPSCSAICSSPSGNAPSKRHQERLYPGKPQAIVPRHVALAHSPRAAPAQFAAARPTARPGQAVSPARQTW
jgi:hypothetical protein